jgi:hypothetical protein
MLKFSKESFGQRTLLFALIILATAISATGRVSPRDRRPGVPVGSGVNPDQTASPGQEIPSPEPSIPGPLASKQKKDLMKANYEKLKRDAEDLAALAKSLQEEIDKSNQNVLSIKAMDKAEKIERLARKIKNESRGY